MSWEDGEKEALNIWNGRSEAYLGKAYLGKANAVGKVGMVGKPEAQWCNCVARPAAAHSLCLQGEKTGKMEFQTPTGLGEWL